MSIGRPRDPRKEQQWRQRFLLRGVCGRRDAAWSLWHSDIPMSLPRIFFCTFRFFVQRFGRSCVLSV